MDSESFFYMTLAELCRSISENPFDLELMENLKGYLHLIPDSFVQVAQGHLLLSLYPYIKVLAANKESFSNKTKHLLVEMLTNLLERKIAIDNVKAFTNFYLFLLCELYDYSKRQFVSISEEYKLAILECLLALLKSVSSDVWEELYVKDRENVSKLAQVVYMCSEFAKKEKSRDIRCAAIMCIMGLARVSDGDDFSDLIRRNKVADILFPMIPGIATTFTVIAMEDSKIGHRVLTMAVRAYGRIIAVVMQDYDVADQKLEMRSQQSTFTGTKTNRIGIKEFEEKIGSMKRTLRWYKATDQDLNVCIKRFRHLTRHEHVKVRLELVGMAADIISSCASTLPQSVGTLIEFLIILSQDEDPDVSGRSANIVEELSNDLSSDELKSAFESMEDGFYKAIGMLPRTSNCADDSAVVGDLNLLIGYVKLFGERNLSHVLLSPTVLRRLVQTLLHVFELDRSNVGVLEEYSLKELNSEPDLRAPWATFRRFKDAAVKVKVERLCAELARSGECFEMVFDSLFDSFRYEPELRKEALFLINALIFGLGDKCWEHLPILKNVLKAYTDDSLNDLRTALDSSEHSLEEVRDNVVQICLLTEGVGKVALALKEGFRPFLLKSLYMILEKAGNAHPLISSAGLSALNNVTVSCGYHDVTDLIGSNFDFFSYHVERKLARLDDQEGVLDVLSAVLKYSEKDVLRPMSDLIEEVLLQSCDRFKERNAGAYLRVFRMFVRSLRRWFGIGAQPEPIKSRRQLEEEHEDFKVTGIDDKEDFPDEDEGKTFEEMYTEWAREDSSDQEGYKRPDPPTHVKLTASILGRSFHFLPSKDRARKLLVLEILADGVEILRDWEDELLPIVHHMWSPLVQRLKEIEEPLVARHGFLLLTALARTSKDFIRIRTTKEVLPGVKDALQTLSKTSRRKDKKEFAYRFAQDYKLQLAILDNLAYVLSYIDAEASAIASVMDGVFPYLSDEQPKDLQEAALNFLKTLAIYDSDLVRGKVSGWAAAATVEHEKNVARARGMFGT